MHALHCQAAFSCTSAVLPRMGYALKWSAMRCCRGLYWHVCVCNLWKTKKKQKSSRLVIGWFLCQVSPISSVVSHPLSLCKQLLPLKLASQLHCRYTLVKFVRGAKSTGRKRKALVPSASDVTQERKKKVMLNDILKMLQCSFFIFIFCSCSEDETRRPLIFVGNTKTGIHRLNTTAKKHASGMLLAFSGRL